MKKRILSMLLAIVMVATLLPTTALADSPERVLGGTISSGMSNFDALLGSENYTYSNGTIKILNDLVIAAPLTFDCSGSTYVLDLNGHTLNIDLSSSVTHKNGKLTITDSVGGGGIASSGVPVVTEAYGTNSLTVSGGTFTSINNNGPALQSKTGNCTISGGTFNGRYALERTSESSDFSTFKLSGSPVLNGSVADIYLWNSGDHPIYYDGYEPAVGNGPVSILLKNFPDKHSGRVVSNWDKTKNISKYFVYSGNRTQNEPYLCAEDDFNFIIAEEPYDAWIGTTRVTRLNQNDVFGDGKVSIAYADNNYALTLNNFTYQGKTHADGRGIIDIANYPYANYKNYFQLSMNVIGTNTITGTNNASCGITAGSNNGTFTLSGTGSLSISGCNYGINVDGSNNWHFTKAKNSDIPTLEITSTTAATNKSTYLYANTDGYQITLGDSVSTSDGNQNISTQDSKYVKIEKAPIVPVISITTQPLDTIVTADSISGSLTAVGTVSNSSSTTPTYQWYSNTTNSNSGGTPISGATGSSFTIPTDLEAGTYYYYCVLSATGADSVSTLAAEVTVNPAPTEPTVPTHTHNCGHSECSGSWENFVEIDQNYGDTTNPTLKDGNTYYFVLGDNMSGIGFNPSLTSGTATVYLCLNGQTINDIKIPAGVTMYICDCASEPGLVSARFNVYGTAMLGGGRYSLLRQMADTTVVHVYGPITLGDHVDFSSLRNKSIILDNAEAKIHFSGQPSAAIKVTPYGAGVFATGWKSSFNSNYKPVSANNAYEVVFDRDSITGELSFVRVTPTTYTVTVTTTPSESGTVSGGGEYTEGTAVTLTATPNTGYRFVNWTEGGTEVSTDASYTFDATEDRNLVANFELDTYTITKAETANGRFTVKVGGSVATKATADATVTITATPDEGYEVDTVTYTSAGGSVTTVTAVEGFYSFTMPAEAVTVNVTFKKIPAPVISGGDDSSPSNTTSKTEKNEDGSVTTTTTNRTTGTVTETTKNTDGTTGTTVTDKNGNIAEISAKVPASAAGAAEKVGKPVTIPVEVFATKSSEEALSVKVDVPANGAAVEIPVENVTPGTVAVIVAKDGTEQVVRTSSVSENGVVVKLESDATVKVVDMSRDFKDVHPVNHWATDAIDFVAARGIFNGTSTDTFTPNGSMTRQAMWMTLARMSGEEPADMAAAREWAVENAVSDGSNPLSTVTRQQYVAMLWRWAVAEGMDVSAGEETNILSFTDANKISDYAVEAFQWACSEGIVGGYDDGSIRALTNASRAHAAAMMMRFCASTVN